MPGVVQPVELIEGDPPLRPVDDVVRDAGVAATRAVVAPFLRQEEIGVEQRLERPLRDADVHGDDAVLHLAFAAQILPLDAGRLVAPLAAACLVDHADGADAIVGQARCVLGELPLEPGKDLVVVPRPVGEEDLQRPHRRPAGQGNGLDAFAWQRAEQSAAVIVEIGAGLLLRAAVAVAGEKA